MCYIDGQKNKYSMMMSMEQSVERELKGETEVFGENLHSATLSTINPILSGLGPNMGRGKLANNRLHYARPDNLLTYWLKHKSYK
jgi:hypothetical protein